MQVKLHDISKVFQNHSVFKNVNLELPSGYRAAILGGNGSGKSTLLKVISTAMMPSNGTVSYSVNGKEIDESNRYRHVSFGAPYMELIEDLTLEELVGFHAKFRPFLNGLTKDAIIERLNLGRFKDKQIKTFSSGMRQRVRLILAVGTQSDLLLLDEPTSNLDPAGKKWYQELVNDFAGERTILVGSNNLKEEYFFTKNTIELSNFK